MERLTTKLDDGNYIPAATCSVTRDGKVDDIDGCKECCDSCGGECSVCVIQKCVNELAQYEDLDEQGLLLRLPCKVGSTVYLIKSDRKIVPRTADMQFLGVLWEDYGKEWFLTQAEAEQRLKEMES